jgi:hypothetical protein
LFIFEIGSVCVVQADLQLSVSCFCLPGARLISHTWLDVSFKTFLVFFISVSSDGGTESSALVDDNGSEEDFSYEDLCQANPRYLQPGGEQLAINEVLEFHMTNIRPLVSKVQNNLGL